MAKGSAKNPSSQPKSIDIFVCSRYPLLSYGIIFNDSGVPKWQSKRLVYLFCQIYHSLIKVVFLISVLITSYLFIKTSTLEIRAILLVEIIYFLGITCMFFTQSKSLGKMTSVVTHVRSQLSIKKLQKLRKSDIIAITMKLGLMTLSGLLLMAELFLVGQQMKKLIFEVYYSFGLAFLHTFSCCTTFTYLDCAAHLYYRIIRVAREYSEDRREKIQLIRTEEYSHPHSLDFIRKSIIECNQVIKSINTHLGVVPFFMLSLIFVSIIFGTTFVVAYRNSNTTYTVITYFALIGNQIYAMYNIVRESSRLSDVMTLMIEEAQHATIATDLDDRSIELRRSRRNLTIFLHDNRSPSLTAAGGFSLSVSLVFSFFNAVVPFTIMGITSVTEIRAKA